MKVCIFIVGSRVRDRNWSSQFGAIRTIAKKTALVDWDGRDKPERVYLDNLVLETAEDVAKREVKGAFQSWNNARPRTQFVDAFYSGPTVWYRDRECNAVKTHELTSAEQMYQAARELEELAAWWETRPKEDK
ncbi:MAG TPA: hypothetical protein VFQ42_22165 [Mycobacterium sp.]|nr:hypothetical protein [Mycobacterium sp.]